MRCMRAIFWRDLRDWLKCWWFCLRHPRWRIKGEAELAATGWAQDEDREICVVWKRDHCAECAMPDYFFASLLARAGEPVRFRPEMRPFFGWRPTACVWVGNSHGLREPHNVHPEMCVRG